MTAQPKTSVWERLAGFCIDNKLIVLVPAVLLVLGGLAASPFDDHPSPLPRSPVAVDAIPDTGANQQIVFTEWPGRSPRDIEDQITYPLTAALLGVPGVETVRSSSMLGFSSIYVIFEDGVDFYWARERLLEKLASMPADTLPADVSPRLGPEATSLGQIFWYTLEGRAPDGSVVGGWDLDELRSVQDWTIRYALQSVPGVAEVSSVGGYVREYQVDIDPEALAAARVTINEVANAVRASNQEIGARTLEINKAEYVIRSRGFVAELEDLEEAVVAVRDHKPIRVREVARVQLGPAGRRGALDDAGADTVGGVVVARFGANPRQVIDAVKEKIDDIAPTLPSRTLADGTSSQITINPFYDRTQLIDETLDTLSTALEQQILITILVVLLMLRHLRSSALISSTLPLAVVVTFMAMKATGVDANVMSLAGIAIAIGTIVDIGIVMVENMVRHLDEASDDEPRGQVLRRAVGEVAPAIATSVATTVVSFLPVFALTAAEGKLFHPLAFTKTYALLAALVLAIGLLPVFAHWLLTRRAPPAPPDDDLVRRLTRSATRPVHISDWVTIAAGLLLAATLSVGLGLYLVLAGLMQLVTPVMPERWRKLPLAFEVAVGVVAVGLILAGAWQPLGAGAPLVSHALFVALSVGLLMAGFALFGRLYLPTLRWCLRRKLLFLLFPAGLLTFGATTWLGFGTVFGWLPGGVVGARPVANMARALPGFEREFMPRLDEGSFLFMPSTMQHASFGTALDYLQRTDAAIAAVPEVDRVVGKIGRVDSALDPAPISMLETVVTYKPEFGYDDQGNWVRLWRDEIRSPDDIWQQVKQAGELPGLTRATKLMPIETRRIMLQTGLRGQMGLKLQGPTLESIESAGVALEKLLSGVEGIQPDTVAAERVVGKPYIEIEPDRKAIARYGMNVADVQRALQLALGGQTLTRTVEGRERYPVRVRFMREERDSVEALQRLLVPTPTGHEVPLGELARLEYVRGPQVIKSEDTFKVAYLSFGKEESAGEVEVVERADRAIKEAVADGSLKLPPGVTYTFVGNYQNQQRSSDRLAVLVPIALVLVLFLLYLQFRRISVALIIYSGVAVAVAGGFVLMWLYGRPGFLDIDLLGTNVAELFATGEIRLSVAVWVGVIALIGIATDNGVVLATYLEQTVRSGPPATSIAEIRERVCVAGERRVRACLMTTATTVLALLPVITSPGRGAEVMVPMAIPILGGALFTLVTLLLVPVLYSWIEELKLRAVGPPEPAAEKLPAD